MSSILGSLLLIALIWALGMATMAYLTQRYQIASEHQINQNSDPYLLVSIIWSAFVAEGCAYTRRFEFSLRRALMFLFIFNLSLLVIDLCVVMLLSERAAHDLAKRFLKMWIMTWM